jgi:hypothetical protein
MCRAPMRSMLCQLQVHRYARVRTAVIAIQLQTVASGRLQLQLHQRVADLRSVTSVQV